MPSLAMVPGCRGVTVTGDAIVTDDATFTHVLPAGFGISTEAMSFSQYFMPGDVVMVALESSGSVNILAGSTTARVRADCPSIARK